MPRLSRAIQNGRKEGEPAAHSVGSHQPPGREMIPPVNAAETADLGSRFRSLLGRPAAETDSQVDTLSLKQLLENQARAEELELNRVYELVGFDTTELSPLQVANTLILLHQPRPKPVEAPTPDDEGDDDEDDETGVRVTRGTSAAPAPVVAQPEMVSWDGARGGGAPHSLMVDGALYEKLTGISNHGRSALSRQLRENIVGKLKHRSYSPADVAAISARLRRPQVYRNERAVTKNGDELVVDWTKNHPIDVIDENKRLLAKRDATAWFKWNWLRYANPRNAKEWLTPRAQLDADWRAGKAAAEKYVEAVRGGGRTDEVLAQAMLRLMSLGGDADLQAREAVASSAPTVTASRRDGSGQPGNHPRAQDVVPSRRGRSVVGEARQQPSSFPTREEFVAFYTSKDISPGVSPVLDVRMSVTGKRGRDLRYGVTVTPTYVKALFRIIPQLTYEPKSGALAVRLESGSVRPFTLAEAEKIHTLAQESHIHYQQIAE